MIQKKLLLLCVLLFSFTVFSQKGIDGDHTVTTSNTILNAYTRGVTDASVGDAFINVADNSLTGEFFTSPLKAGDLILIIQMQSVDMDYAASYNGQWSTGYPLGVPDSLRYYYAEKYGIVTNYKSAGKYEMVEVVGVQGTGGILLSCGLKNRYYLVGNIQVIRIPRFNKLTLSNTGSITAKKWDGSTGGVVALEVEDKLELGNGTTPSINVNSLGFRGGYATDNNGTADHEGPHTNVLGSGDAFIATVHFSGAKKGEGIYGDSVVTENFYSNRGRSQMANGGGGGGVQNAGGGGGSNVGFAGVYSGRGVLPAGYNPTAWALEDTTGRFWTALSSGGGRGGHSYSLTELNPLTNGPNRVGWNGAKRKENGGLGGEPLIYDQSRIFLGGGGGAGNQDSYQGGSGGRGGGIVIIDSYGSVTGNRPIQALGENGGHTNPLNQSTSSSGASSIKGNDGAGGGGGGGAILIRNMNALPTDLKLETKGGNGGNFRLTRGLFSSKPRELCGPGGAGQGGMISVATGTPLVNIQGGSAGIILSGGATPTHMNAMPTNGATDGGLGMLTANVPFYDLIVRDTTICNSPQAVLLKAKIIGNPPSGTTIYWYSSLTSTTILATGGQFTTPVITGTVTYWVGTCPGTFRKPITVTVTPAPVISGTPILTHPTCQTTGSITGLTVNNGSAPYTYNWSNGINTLAANNLSSGTYSLTVSDSKGCSATSGPHVLIGTSGPTLITPPSITNQGCNGDGSLLGMTVSSNVAITEIKLNGLIVTAYDQQLPAGSYTYSVVDANNCVSTFGPYVIQSISTPTISNTANIQQATCNSSGSITGLVVSNGTAPYSYSWDGVASTSADLANATVGSHTLIVTDANNCTVNFGPVSITMQSIPVISGTAVLAQPNCLISGNITGLTASGGIGGLTYSWNGNPSANSDLFGANAGSYTLTVTDANGCTANSGPYTLSSPQSPVISGQAIITDITCNSNGTITGLSVSGGTAPYSYMYNSTISTGADFSTNIAGSYTLRVGDVNGCIVSSGPHVINQIQDPTIAGLTVNSHQTCNALGEASFTGTTGGTAPYTYLWSDNVTTGLTAQLPAGNYTVTVTDANGCTSTSAPIVINRIADPILNVSTAIHTQITCLTQGSVTGITVSGGTTPYTYAWSGGVAASTLNLNGVGDGTYTLTVTDANGCSVASQAYVFTTPQAPTLNGQPLVTPITCLAPGSVSGINITGGLAPYIVKWNGVVQNAPYTFSSSNAGTHTLTITDANDCVHTETYTFTAPSRPLIGGSANVTDVTCTEGGKIQGFTVSSGTAPYTYNWNGTSTATPDLSGAQAGNYVLTITDANGCTTLTPSITIGGMNVPVIIGTPAIVQPGCILLGAISGLSISGGLAPYSYTWSGTTQTTLDITNLNAGSYTLTVTDTRGCTAVSNPIVLAEPSQPIIGGTPIIEHAKCTQAGSVHGLSVTQGTPTYIYSWDGNITNGIDNSNLSAGSHVFKVVDAKGCSAEQTFVINPAIGGNVSIHFSPDPAFINENVIFTATSNEILSGYQWSINGKLYPNGLPNVDSLFNETTTVFVEVRAIDINGCIVLDTIQITVFGDLVIPNVISANGDGVNDYFYLGPVLPNTQLTILDRWGIVVYKTDEYKNEWDGKDMKGHLLMDGVYTYIIKTKKGEEFHGFVHIVDSQR